MLARDDIPRPDGGQADAAESAGFAVPATNDGTRAAIQRILALIDDAAFSREDVNLLEIALAEVFNNIVEHAYRDVPGGTMEVFVARRDPGIHVTIWDEGAAMPAGRLPGGAPADPALEAHEQAEGGYGLFMIRQLARKLRYERVGDRNRLSFRVSLTPA